MRVKEIVEQATAGATSAGNIATVNNPHIANPDRLKKSYTGSPGKSGTKSPKHKKAKKQKPSDNALNMPNVSLFGGPLVRR
jgi:hypothetical protein|tara:strand:- start:99 stop:341 length:243 start_codon:yes stop_codon:yes gene_type:complete